MRAQRRARCARARSRHAPPHVARAEQAAYDDLKAQWADRLLALLHRVYPGTKGRVAFADLSRPLTLEHYLRAHGGAGVGLDVTPARLVSATVMREVDMRHPRVPRLWRRGVRLWPMIAGLPLMRWRVRRAFIRHAGRRRRRACATLISPCARSKRHFLKNPTRHARHSLSVR